MKQRLRVKYEAIFAERLASATPSSVNRWRRLGAAHFLSTRRRAERDTAVYAAFFGARSTACRSASIRLRSSAIPLPAMSKAVP